MPSTREMRRRIQSVKNIAKLTNAKQMVAASKMRRAQERVHQALPYAEQLRALVSRLSAVAVDEPTPCTAFLHPRPVQKAAIVLVSPNGGLCGALPGNMNREALETSRRLQQEEGLASSNILYVPIGRKGREFLQRREVPLLTSLGTYSISPSLSDIAPIAHTLRAAYLQGTIDSVTLIYPRFVSTVLQKPVSLQLLPVPALTSSAQENIVIDYIYEPDAASLLDALLEKYVDVQLYLALLESIASEQAASMIAMKNATDKAKELVTDLTLQYNKLRQATITTQILEVVAGANA